MFRLFSGIEETAKYRARCQVCYETKPYPSSFCKEASWEL